MQLKKAFEAFQSCEELYEKFDMKDGRVYRNYAMYYALKKKPDKAIEMLKKTVELGYVDLDWFNTDDSMDSLRKRPDFQELLKELE